MKGVLRSVIDFGGTITPEHLALNWTRLEAAQLQWHRPDDDRIVKRIADHFAQFIELPSAETLQDYFERLGDIEVIERLKDIASDRPYVRTNFAALVDTAKKDQQKVALQVLLRETNEIVVKGREVVDEHGHKYRLEGVEAARDYFVERSWAVTAPIGTEKTSGDLRGPGTADELWNEYVVARDDQGKSVGSRIGLDEVDAACRGAKRGDLWVHAAFAGELKTSLAVTWALNAATHYRENVVYISLEMRWAHIRKIAAVMHSGSPRWDRPALDYRKVRDGHLNAADEAFYQRVLADFERRPDHCHIHAVSPDRDFNVGSVRAEVERLHRKFDVGLVVIDHGGLLDAKRRSKEYGVELNSIVRDAKKFALQFNGGEGVPVLLLWQINRDGKDEAAKNDGVYKMRALTWANEVEKSADVITTTYLDDEHRRAGTTKISNLKNRDNAPFAPFVAGVDWGTRRVSSRRFVASGGPGMSIDEEDAYAAV